MSMPQPGIFAEDSSSHHALEACLKPGLTLKEQSTLMSALASEATRSDAPYRLVVAFGPNLINAAAPDIAAPKLDAFNPISGAKEAPATNGDILVWVHGTDRSDVFDGALRLAQLLKPYAELTIDLPGFTYHDLRDLTGFIDGSANPKGDERQEVALVPDGEDGAGGAYVITMKWRHDLEAWNALPVDEQEQIIGRTKPDSVEFEGDALADNSHVGRADVKVDGVTQKIYRRSFPYGTAGENGLYFVAFTHSPSRFEVILSRMFGVSGDGIHDRLIQFSTPQTGACWFAPSLETLGKISHER